MSEGDEDVREFVFLTDHSGTAGVENVADSLLLREDEAAFGCGFVDGDDKDDNITLSEEVSDESFFWRGLEFSE